MTWPGRLRPRGDDCIPARGSSCLLKRASPPFGETTSCRRWACDAWNGPRLRGPLISKGIILQMAQPANRLMPQERDLASGLTCGRLHLWLLLSISTASGSLSCYGARGLAKRPGRRRRKAARTNLATPNRGGATDHHPQPETHSLFHRPKISIEPRQSGYGMRARVVQLNPILAIGRVGGLA
jgi:hypothetical protein